MGYLGRRIGLSQDKGDSNPGGADGAVGGGIIDLFATGYFNREETLSPTPSPISASGGVINDYVDPTPGIHYRSHTFTTSGSFVVSDIGNNLTNVEYLIVGGAGGGGSGAGGGGGAGGVLTGSFAASKSTYSVTIGAGGDGGTSNASGTKGGDTTFGSEGTAGGGGYGGTQNGVALNSAPNPYAPGIIGSGGGGGGGTNAPAQLVYQDLLDHQQMAHLMLVENNWCSK